MPRKSRLNIKPAPRVQGRFFPHRPMMHGEELKRQGYFALAHWNEHVDTVYVHEHLLPKQAKTEREYLQRIPRKKAA
jgi:hypothetical protein